jgi:hypothetical protein
MPVSDRSPFPIRTSRHAASPPTLRLADSGPEMPQRRGPSRLDASAEARRRVARENREASIERSLDPLDPRWQVAVATAEALEGSLLSFERRRRVLAFAARVGVRAFDANLIIAAVQDRARRGEPVAAAAGTVALAAAQPDARRRPSNALYLAVAMAAVAAHGLLAWWLLA